MNKQDRALCKKVLDFAHSPNTTIQEADMLKELVSNFEAASASLVELRGALAEQVAECFDPTCVMCTRHEALLRKIGDLKP